RTGEKRRNSHDGCVGAGPGGHGRWPPGRQPDPASTSRRPEGGLGVSGQVPQSGSGIGSRWLIEGHTKKTAQTVRDVNGYNENSTKILLLLAIIFCNSELTG